MKRYMYATYLTDLNQTNAGATNVGVGRTREEAEDDARYYANQLPWVRTVAMSRAPAWVRREVAERLDMIPAEQIGCVLCGQNPQTPLERRAAENYCCCKIVSV